MKMHSLCCLKLCETIFRLEDAVSGGVFVFHEVKITNEAPQGLRMNLEGSYLMAWDRVCDVLIERTSCKMLLVQSTWVFRMFPGPPVLMVWKTKIFPNIFPNDRSLTNHLQSPLWCFILWSLPKSWGVPIVFSSIDGIFHEINHRFYHFGVPPCREIFIWTRVYQSIYH